MSHVMRKPTVCTCKNKDTDQLCSNCTADQRLCFCFMVSIIPLLYPKFQASNNNKIIIIIVFILRG